MKTAGEILQDKSGKMITVSADKSVFEAVQAMVDAKIGAILVEESGDIVGIYSERDLLRNILIPGFDPKNAKVSAHMTGNLHCAAPDTPLAHLEEMFLGLFIRHIPIKDGDTFIGVVSVGDVIRASLLAKDRKIKELQSIASWEYYENWGWRRKPRQGEEPDK